MRPGPFPVRRTPAMAPAFGLLVVCLGTLVVPFDSAVNVAFPDIVRSFGLAIPAIQWVIIAYTLTYAALMLVFGRIGDMLGYRRIFLLGCGWSLLAFLLCATAPSFAWLLVARVLQGVGAALVLSCGPALVTGLYPESQRSRVLGIYTMLFGLGGALGPLLAGALVARWGWPAVFWARAPFALAAFALAWRLPPAARRSGPQRFDAAGAVLLVLAISACLLTLNQLRQVEQTATGAILAGVVALLSGAGFIRQELRTAQPILELRFFRDIDFSLANIAQTALNVSAFAVLLLVPFYLDRFSGLVVTVQGAVLAASNIGVMLAAPLAGRWAGTIPPRRLALIGTACMAAGLGFIGFTGAQPDLALLTAAMFLQGGGLGLFQVAYFDIATVTIPVEARGVAGSLVMMTRTVGVVTGATVLMLIFQALRAAAEHGHDAGAAAFLSGFHGAFRFAAVLPVLMVGLMLLRGWGRR